MEKSLDLILQQYPLDEKELKTYHPLAFAYVGDAVYDMIIRTMIVVQGNRRPNKYHKDTISYVNAAAQTEMYQKIKSSLTEEEQNVFRRGKNTKTFSPAKNQSLHDYRIATGFETLIGYLYLSGQMERILQLVKIGLSQMFETVHEQRFSSHDKENEEE